MPKVARFNVTPVKSTALHNPGEIMLEECGVATDRQFFLINERGHLFGSARYGPMIRARAEYDPEREFLSIRFPEGAAVDGDAHAGPEGVVADFWGRDVPGHVMDERWNKALSDYLGAPVRLVRCDRPGDASDVHPVTLVSNESVRELGRRAGRTQPLDGRRFRMLIEITGCEPYEEDTWSGREARIGEAVLRIHRPVPRCVITTLSPDTGIKDFDTLKAIRDQRGKTPDGLPFGVYAVVVTPGVARVGDPVEPL